MSIKPKRSLQEKPFLSDVWRHFLETGQYFGLKEIFPDMTNREKFDIFQLGCSLHPDGNNYKKLRKIWLSHKDEILRDFKKQGKKWKPWAASLFD